MSFSPSPFVAGARRFVGIAIRLLGSHLSLVPANSAKHRNLAVIHRERCGSTVLGSLLDQNPNIFWDGEALERQVNPSRWLRRQQGAKGEPGFKDLKSLMRFARNRTYGFSLKGLHGYQTTERMVEELRRAGFDCFVILERRNVLRWLVSAEVGTRDKVWHIDPAKQRVLRTLAIPLYYSDGESLRQRLEALEQWYAQLRTCLEGSNVLNLAYEDHILSTPVNAYSQVCNFIGVEVTSAIIAHGVVNPFPLRKMILNFDEVKAHLSGSRFEWMLDE